MTYRIAVRALCEFTAKAGDLDLRFTPSPTAQQGIAGHRTVASRRSAGYQAELSLQGEYAGVQVRGRADGYDPLGNVLEEVKTYRGDFKASRPITVNCIGLRLGSMAGWCAKACNYPR